MIACPILSYGFSHHLFHQAAGLASRVPGYRFATSSYVSPRIVNALRAPFPALARSLARRSHPNLSAALARTYPQEHLYQFAARLTRRPYSYFAAHDRMARRIAHDFEAPGILIAIDTGAESLFRAWHGRSRLVLDLSIATPHYRAHLFTAAERSADHVGVRFHHPGEWELTRYAAELALADLVLCPSEFVRDSCRFLGVPEEKLKLVPYGFDPGRFAPPAVPRPVSSPLRLGFAGTVCYRKGSHLLLAAFARLHRDHPDAELHLYGDVQDAPANTPGSGVIFHGRVPQEDLATAFRTLDLLAFPTLFEGSAYVVYQALASGLPVITTDRAGSILDPTCGVLLPAITAEALYSTLAALADNRTHLASLAAAAPSFVARHTWADYSMRLHTTLAAAFPGTLPNS